MMRDETDLSSKVSDLQQEVNDSGCRCIVGTAKEDHCCYTAQRILQGTDR